MKRFTIAVVLILVAFFLFGGGERKVVKTEMEHYKVTEGMTVWGVATVFYKQQNRYQDMQEFVYVIRKHNDLLNKPLQVGQVLEIPLYTVK